MPRFIVKWVGNRIETNDIEMISAVQRVIEDHDLPVGTVLQAAYYNEPNTWLGWDVVPTKRPQMRSRSAVWSGDLTL